MRPTFELRIGGFTATDAAPAGGPTALAVDRDVDVALDVARVRLADRSDVEVGQACTLALGLDTAPRHVFGGTVIEVRVDTRGATIVAGGAMAALLDLRAAASFSQATLGTIVRDLAGRAGLVATDIAQGPMLPWFFLDIRRGAHGQLRDLAARFGFDLFADRNGGLVLRALPGGGPGSAASAVPAGIGLAGPAAGPRFGADVIAARAVQRAAPWQAVAVGGESPASSRGASAATWLTTDDDVCRGESGSGGRQLLVMDALARTKDLARDLADGTLRFAGRGAHIVDVTVPGRSDTDLGDSVAVGQAPDVLLGGNGHVRRLRHRLDGRHGFTSRVGVALPAQGSGPAA